MRYYAALSDGGYCAELVTAGERRRGAVCTTDATTANHPIGVTIRFTDPVKTDSPVTVSGEGTREPRGTSRGAARDEQEGRMIGLIVIRRLRARRPEAMNASATPAIAGARAAIV